MLNVLNTQQLKPHRTYQTNTRNYKSRVQPRPDTVPEIVKSKIVQAVKFHTQLAENPYTKSLMPAQLAKTAVKMRRGELADMLFAK